jgi:hypothetical protein
MDIDINDQGTIVSFTPLTEAAQEWFKANVESESWQWRGFTLCVDHRYALDLITGLSEAGFQLAQ